MKLTDVDRVATMSRISLLVSGLFVPVVFSMQLCVVSEMQCTTPTSLLVFVGNMHYTHVPTWSLHVDLASRLAIDSS